MTHKDPELSVREFLQREKKRFDTLLNKLQEQLDAIQKQDEPRLQGIIRAKAELLESREKEEPGVEKILAGLSRTAVEAIEKKTGALKKEVEEVLAKIIELENTCQVELQAKKFLTQDKIFDLKQGRTLLKGYGTPPRIKPRISKNI